MNDPDCIFCKIIAHQAPAEIVYEDAGAIAFLDVHPIVPGHILVVPKNHCRNLFDFDAASGESLMRAERAVAQAMRAAFNADGLTVLQSNERAGGQSVFHYHAHIVPRYNGDGLLRRPEQLGTRTSAEKPSVIAQKIRAHVGEG